MNGTPIEINLKLANEKVQFTAVSSTRPDQPITMDYLPPIGDGEGFLGLELLTMSFAGCVSTAIVALLRRMGKSVNNYRMQVLGYKNENPLSLEKIRLTISVETQDATDEDVQKALSMAEQISPVWLAIKNNVEVEHQYELIKQEVTV